MEDDHIAGGGTVEVDGHLTVEGELLRVGAVHVGPQLHVVVDGVEVEG